MRHLVFPFVLISLLLIPLLSIRVHGAELSDLSYTTNSNGVTITDCDTSASGELVIPTTIDGFSVYSIGSNAFRDCSALTSVTIPDSVTFIGDLAFLNCTALTSVTIPNSVTSMGHSAFRVCSALTSVTIPDSITSIGDWAFRDCSSLTNVTIPSSITNIAYRAFYRCTALTSVVIPDSVTSVGLAAFALCDSLNEVTFKGAPPSMVDIPFPTSNHLFTFRARAGFGSTFAGHPVTHELRIKATYINPSNNYLRIDTDALNTVGLKALHSRDIGFPFTEVVGIGKLGEGRVIIPPDSSARQGNIGFYKVIYE